MEKSLIELAAEQRYPYTENNTAYFCSVQNSRRGDFCDGAIWVIEQGNPLWVRMYEALLKINNLYEPENDSEKRLFSEIKTLIDQAEKAKVKKKKFDRPTYPIKLKG